MGSFPASKIPVIDFSREDLKPGSNLWLSTCQDVCNALGEYGCFVALYNKLPAELDDAIFDASKQLFDLPTEIKRKNTNGKPFHGYVGEIPSVPLHEGLGIDYVTDMEEAQNFTNLMWPNGNDHFCKTVYSYSKIVAELDQMVVRMIFENFGIEKYYESHVESTSYLLRFLKYLASNTPDQPKQAFPCHTDKTFFSILHQNQVNGLEVKTKNDEWVGFDLTPLSFVVMAGDASKAWSNGRIHSCDHRVTMSGKQTRYTLGLFSFINGTVHSPEELVDDEHPLKYKPFNNVAMVHFYALQGRVSAYSLEAFCGI